MPSFAVRGASPNRLRRVTMPPLHAGQLEVVRDPTRFKVLTCGRRWGKTRMCAAITVHEALEGKRCWWVAPSYGVAVIGWREITNLAAQIPGVTVRGGDRLLLFPGGGTIQVRSAAGQTGLRGEGLDLVIIDECAFVREKAWTDAIRPTLSDRKGRALLISTPNGRNWFWKVWLRGNPDEQEKDADWRSWRFPTVSNPYIDPAEVAEAKRNLPERSFQQEYEAQFLDDAGSVFRKVMASATATERDIPEKGHSYIFSVDWGKMEDYTVISVLDTGTRELVWLERYGWIDYVAQRRRLRALYDLWQPEYVAAERNAMGEPVIDELRAEGIVVQPFTTTWASKKEAIETLQLDLEKDRLKILPDPILVNELQAYEMTRTPSGLVKYGAPEGYHDDCVMSLAIGAWHLDHTRPPEVFDSPLL